MLALKGTFSSRKSSQRYHPRTLPLLFTTMSHWWQESLNALWSGADDCVGLVSLFLELRENQIFSDITILKPGCSVSNLGSGLAV